VDILLASSLVPFAYGVFELASGFNSEFRSQATFAHANIFAFYLLVVISGILYKIYNSRARPSAGAIFLYVALLFTATGFLLLTQTRSAWIAFAAMFGIAALLVDKRLLLAGLLIPALLFVPAVQNRLEDTSSSTDLAAGEALSSYAWRQRLWEQAFDDLKGNDLLGKGLGAFHINSTSFSDFVKDDETTEAHSAYVQTIYENGWIGLSALLWIYIACIGMLLNSWRSAPQESAIGIACVSAMLIVNYSDNTPYYLSYNWYAWIFVAFMICKCRAIQASKAAPVARSVSRPSSLRQLRT
jgi:O-antigen ligase